MFVHMENIEIWKDIPGWEGLYEVSSLGRIKSIKKKIILKPFISNRGYYRIRLHKDKKGKNHSLHRIVAQVFPEICGEWFEGCVINHKDCNTLNNMASNLEVCTAAYNNSYLDHNQKISESKKGKPIKPNRPKIVGQYTLDGKLIATYPSARQTGKQTKINYSHIIQCCNGNQKTCGGFIWKYI